jgi:hypothetical protein
VQLQRNLSDLQKRGIGLAAISYDSPGTLKTFADARGITFPLLSDAGSQIIKRYDILNAEATGRAAGVPYPGTFLLDRQGIVVARSFEDRYQERGTAPNLLAQTAASQAPGRLAQTAETPHLSITMSASDDVVAPGVRVSLLIDVAPKSKMHVYAPEQKTYIPIALSLQPDDSYKAHPARFPKAEKYFFEPLQETQLVFSKPFRIVQDITVAVTPAVRERASAAGASVIVTGTLRYQACDDKICYTPRHVPVSWTFSLKPLER